MNDKRIEDYIDRIRSDLTQLKDNRFYGFITEHFTLRNGVITRLRSSLDKEFIRPEDIKKGGSK